MCTRYLHPEGLPSDYTISMMLRLLPETPQEPFALWEILDKDNEPLVGLIMDSMFESPVLLLVKLFFVAAYKTLQFDKLKRQLPALAPSLSPINL